MSPVQNFGAAASGKVPETALPADVIVMGKSLGAESLDAIATALGQYVEDGVARPVNALTASVIATPGGGLAPKGHETVEAVYKGGGMFGIEEPGTPAVK